MRFSLQTVEARRQILQRERGFIFQDDCSCDDCGDVDAGAALVYRPHKVGSFEFKRMYACAHCIKRKDQSA